MKRCRKTGFQHKLPATQATCYYMESLLKGLSTAQPAWEGVLCGKIFMTWMVHVTGRIRQIQVLSTYIIHTEMLQNTVLGYLGPVSRRPRKVFAPGKQEQNLTRYDYRAVLFTYFLYKQSFHSIQEVLGIYVVVCFFFLVYFF